MIVKPLVSDQVLGPKVALTVYAPSVAPLGRLKTDVMTPVVVLRVEELAETVVARDGMTIDVPYRE